MNHRTELKVYPLLLFVSLHSHLEYKQEWDSHHNLEFGIIVHNLFVVQTRRISLQAVNLQIFLRHRYDCTKPK